MPVSLRLLRYFVAAAQSGSTTAAANELSVSQPSISVAVRELEALFGEDLFARGPGTKMSLTRFGTRKLDEARRLLKAAAAFEADDGGDPTRGEVQIGVFSTIAPVYLPLVLRIARERYPHLAVRFVEGDLAADLRRRVALRDRARVPGRTATLRARAGRIAPCQEAARSRSPSSRRNRSSSSTCRTAAIS
jgi:DNA-binding transcriptional LysR family regulator